MMENKKKENQNLEQEEQGRPSAFFDFDDTLFYGDSILYWTVYLLKHHPFLAIWRIPYFLVLPFWFFGLATTSYLKRLALWPSSWIKPEEREKLAAEFAQKIIPQYLYPEIVRRMKLHREEGLKTLVLTASPTLWADYLVNYLPVDEVEGTRVVFPQSGLRFPRFEQGNFKGGDKVKWLRSRSDWPADGKGCWSYSDGYSDLPLLLFAEHAVTVHPSFRLKKVAIEKGWTILRPRRPREGWRRLYVKLRMLVWARHMPEPLQTIKP